MPVEVLLADEREVLPGRHAEARAERPAELARAARARLKRSDLSAASHQDIVARDRRRHP